MKICNTVIISDDNRDLFRVHFFENQIKFDARFSDGIINNEFICEKMIEINEGWAERRLEVVDVLEQIALLVEANKNIFEELYLQDYELNKEGRYVDLFPLDSILITNMDDKANNFYAYLKNENVLTPIDKKEFESNIKIEPYSDMYIDLYKKIYKRKRLKFYKYGLNDNFNRKTCSFVATDKEVLFGYVF